MSFGNLTDFPEDTAHSVDILDALARRVGNDARAENVFGDPITQGDVTVVPVAKVNWAFGGGSGSGGDDTIRSDDFGEGGGGAAAVSARPFGYIEIRPGGTRFQATPDRDAPWLKIAAAGLALWMCLRGIRALRR